MPLALPAPARFKLSKSINLPRVGYWTHELDYWRAKKPDNYFHTARDLAEKIEMIKTQLDLAEFMADYVATHDCRPKFLEKNVDKMWGNRSAKVQVEDSIYRVYVSMGRTVRIAFKPRGENTGHHWHLTVNREGADRRIVDGDRCEKSAGLGSAAVRAHLVWKWRTTRGYRV